MVVGVVNPTGRMMPYETSGKEKSQCRLPAAVALVEHGLVDALYLPEANVDANGVRAVETYMASVEEVEVIGAPSSAAVSTMEQMVVGSPMPARVSGGALMLLRAPLARRIQKVAYYCSASGRLLHTAYTSACKPRRGAGERAARARKGPPSALLYMVTDKKRNYGPGHAVVQTSPPSTQSSDSHE